jgi:hypothetical protein
MFFETLLRLLTLILSVLSGSSPNNGQSQPPPLPPPATQEPAVPPAATGSDDEEQAGQAPSNYSIRYEEGVLVLSYSAQFGQTLFDSLAGPDIALESDEQLNQIKIAKGLRCMAPASGSPAVCEQSFDEYGDSPEETPAPRAGDSWMALRIRGDAAAGIYTHLSPETEEQIEGPNGQSENRRAGIRISCFESRTDEGLATYRCEQFVSQGGFIWASGGDPAIGIGTKTITLED